MLFSRLSKASVLTMFRKQELPHVRAAYERDGRVDRVARAEAWSNYTDALCKDGMITLKQYESWSNPF